MYAIFAWRGTPKGGWRDFHSVRANVDRAMETVEALQAGPIHDAWQIVNLDTHVIVSSAVRIRNAEGEHLGWERELTKKGKALARRKK